jgi:hypothetical protein
MVLPHDGLVMGKMDKLGKIMCQIGMSVKHVLSNQLALG